jgi:7-cyano-7-deazaguanine synthase
MPYVASDGLGRWKANKQQIRAVPAPVRAQFGARVAFISADDKLTYATRYPGAGPMPTDQPTTAGFVEARTAGVLLSGGIDSAVLLGQFLRMERCVVPFYVRMGCLWEASELEAARRFLAAIDAPNLADLVLLEMPVADLYGNHWSLSGNAVPDERTADDAVFLPGRNPLLLIKPALWCLMNGVSQLAIATLANNPFDDATPEFFRSFQEMMRQATEGSIEILRPFADLTKDQVVQMAQSLPLELTFSCLAPVDGLHCGLCNKCAERHRALRGLEGGDPTRYAHS